MFPQFFQTYDILENDYKRKSSISSFRWGRVFIWNQEENIGNFIEQRTSEAYFMTAEHVNELDLVLKVECDLNDQNT